MYVIYTPRGQALEYAPLATNPYRGCGHACRYCYVPSVLRMDREEFDSGANKRKNYLSLLRKDCKHLADNPQEIDQVLFCFTTDPYHPGNTRLTRESLQTLIEFDIPFCTLTKGGTRSLRDIDLFRPSMDAFGTTLTFLDDAMSKKWEPQAALPQDRLGALRKFHDSGIFTWVSIEPTLNTKSAIKIIETTASFVDFYKIGRANYLPMTKSTDWKEYTEKVIETCHRLGVKHYIKHDLQPFLPYGYENQLRIPQHN